MLQERCNENFQVLLDRANGVSNVQLWRHFIAAVTGLHSGNSLNQCLDRKASDFGVRELHCCESSSVHLNLVVDPSEGNVLGHSHSHALELVPKLHGKVVIGAHDCRCSRSQNLLCRIERHAALHTCPCFDNPTRQLLQFSKIYRLDKCPTALQKVELSPDKISKVRDTPVSFRN